MEYYIVDSKWDIESTIQEYSSDFPTREYSIFSTEGNFKYDSFTKRTKSGYWLLQYRRENDEFKNRLKHFINYENDHGRTVLIHTSIKNAIKAILKNNEPLLENDYSVFVHSTGRESFIDIMKAKKLIANAFLSKKYEHFNEIDKYMKLEPQEYNEYVMLGKIEDNTEYIVACNQYGKFITNKETTYRPGARIYLDGKKLYNDGLLVFDGVHVAKVHKEIDLDIYALLIISYLDFNKEEWKMNEFMFKCNEKYKNHPTIAST